MEWPDFERINANSEGQPFERKVQGQFKKGLKALCGMVNSQHGKGFLAIGVDDDGNVEGLEGDTDAFQRKVTDHARDSFVPRLELMAWPLRDPGGALILVLEAERRAGVHLHGYDGRTYMREGESTHEMSPEEIADLTAKRRGGPSGGHFVCPQCNRGMIVGMHVGPVLGPQGVERWANPICESCGIEMVRP